MDKIVRFLEKEKSILPDCIIVSGVIIPPSWIVKLPRKGSFKSSLKHSPKKGTDKGGYGGGGTATTPGTNT